MLLLKQTCIVQNILLSGSPAGCLGGGAEAFNHKVETGWDSRGAFAFLIEKGGFGWQSPVFTSLPFLLLPVCQLFGDALPSCNHKPMHQGWQSEKREGALNTEEFVEELLHRLLHQSQGAFPCLLASEMHNLKCIISICLYRIICLSQWNWVILLVAAKPIPN